MPSSLTLDRRLSKLEFIQRHIDLCDMAFIPVKFYKYHSFGDYKAPAAQKMIALARTEIGYSPRTNDVDIYISLSKFYKQTFQNI